MLTSLATYLQYCIYIYTLYTWLYSYTIQYTNMTTVIIAMEVLREETLLTMYVATSRSNN